MGGIANKILSGDYGYESWNHERMTMQLLKEKSTIEAPTAVAARIEVSPAYSDRPDAGDLHRLDPLAQLRANVDKLCELEFKLNYILGEIAYAAKK